MDLEMIDREFFAFPFPSDLRLNASGQPDLTHFPNPRRSAILDSILPIAAERLGWPVLPVACFQFSAPLWPHSIEDVIAGSIDSSILIIDIDRSSPERGALVPAIAMTLVPDRYTNQGFVLAVAPRPGWILAPDRAYAVVVRRGLRDARGEPVERAENIALLAEGHVPTAPWGARAAELYAPLWETLDAIGVPRADVATATVFTTGDVALELRALSERVLEAHDVRIDGLHIDPEDGAHPRYCELLGTATLPQFQRGTPPFEEEGLFEYGADGLPRVQRMETIPLVITIPRREMPASGWPLVTYFHGSGGVAAQLVDRGPYGPGEEPALGEGPAHVLAEHGLAAFGSALPISPDRVPGAGATAYLDFGNLAMTRDLFRQGVIEQRLLLKSLADVRIDPSLMASCTGVSLPPGATEHHFDSSAFAAMGQSMGGMYANMVGAIEPRYRALVPTGAGGYWTYFIVETTLVPGIVFAPTLGIPNEGFTHLHPALFVVEMGLEPIDPFVFMPRLSRRPLPGLEARPVYTPVGMGDSYFPASIYDAAALAYGHEQAGDIVWDSMQDALALMDRDGLVAYPAARNLVSDNGTEYTGVVVQYAGDGFSDPHEIFMQLPEVRYQWGCFLSTALRTGSAVLPAPAPLGTPCPAE
jgi:hypothetical protein